MSLSELIQQKTELENMMESIREQLSVVMCDIEHAIASPIADLRRLQGKDTGTINLMLEGFKITETVPKKVEWDQEKLGELFNRIMSAGDKPNEYMRMKLDVPEKLYEGFSEPVKALFAEARTIKAGKSTLKFEVAHA